MSDTLNKTLTVISFVLIALAFPGIGLCDSSEPETTAIRGLEKQQQDAWNRHDAKAYATCSLRMVIASTS
jgi:hypothetical protein